MDQLKEYLTEIVKEADEKLLRMLAAVSREYNNENVPTEKRELYRLVYTSARSAKCTDEEVEKILAASHRNNKGINVTGILIHTKDRFLQVLEGEREQVTSLYNKIEKDDRHGGSIMRFCEPVSKRHFSEWNMASKKVHANDIQYNTSISDQKKRLYESMMDGDLSSYKDEGMRVLKTFLLIS